MRWWVNGEEGAPLAPGDRGLAYGDGLFETIAVRGGEPRFLARHLERLELGLRRLGIDSAPHIAPGTAVRRALAAVPAGGDGVAKLVVTRGGTQRGQAPAPDAPPNVLVGVDRAPRRPPEYWQEGIAVRWCRTRLGRNPALAGMKHLSRLELVAASREWSAAEGPAEGLLLDTAGQVVCGTMTNVFTVTAKRLLTPGIEHCGVAGVMRRRVLENADALGIPVEIGPLSRAAVTAAEEIFLTNALIGVWPVRSLGNWRAGRGRVTTRLMRRLAAQGVSECDL